MASLIIDFLQVFHLDFTLAVFQPEINSVSVLLPADRAGPACWSNNLELSVLHSPLGHAIYCARVSCPQLNGLDSREQVSCELDITETDMNRNTPLLLELVKRGRHKEKASIFSEVKKDTPLHRACHFTYIGLVIHYISVFP